MPETYIPMITRNTNASLNAHIVIDPLVRIEGHLRIEATVTNGIVEDAWSAGTMFRGIETILKGHDPRDAWVFTQRVCGVCTTVHSLASVRAVENALGISVPENANLLRNLLAGSQMVADHVMHFYHLHGFDWIDVVSSLAADPVATSDLQKSISSWHNNSPEYFAAVKTRVQNLVDSGQLGLFANGFWGHPAYALPPEGNLLAVAHYLEALDWQRQFVKIHAILGGKNPHPQTYMVGGMAIPLDPNQAAAINLTKIAQLRSLIQEGLTFVTQVYLPDLKLIAHFYPDWKLVGCGVGNFLCYGDFPVSSDGKAAVNWLPEGIVYNKDLRQLPQPLNHYLVREYVAHSWYSYTSGDETSKHPYLGETQPNYTGPQPPYQALQVESKYSWLKTPRYDEQPMEVGPLARLVVAYTSGVTRARELFNQFISDMGWPPAAFFSTIGRVAARGLETQMIAEQMATWLSELENRIVSGDLEVHNGMHWDPSSWPAECEGMGTTEAPRGGLGHWVRILNQKIENYQMVVPTTWNGSPRDAAGQRGPFEAALVGTPVADPSRPLEILRTIHSFDPCMSCAVHLIDAHGTK